MRLYPARAHAPVGAGLMVRNLKRLLEANPGFRSDNVETPQVNLPYNRYPPGPRRVAFYDEVLRRARVLPAVSGSAWVNALPLNGGPTWAFSVVGHTYPPGQEPNADARVVTAEYLRVMGVPLLRGRNFTDSDGMDGARVVLVNQTLAKRIWPGEDPLGKQVLRWFQSPPFRVIGVVGDTRYTGLNREAGMEMYGGDSPRALPKPLPPRRRCWTLGIRTEDGVICR